MALTDLAPRKGCNLSRGGGGDRVGQQGIGDRGIPGVLGSRRNPVSKGRGSVEDNGRRPLVST